MRRYNEVLWKIKEEVMMIENCADILRGSLDPADYRQPGMTLKKLNDTFEENAEKIIQEGKSEKETYVNKNRHYFCSRR
jgi:hypothetical protein